MKKLILLLMITLAFTSCGKDKDDLPTPVKYVSPVHRSDCEYVTLRAWWCRRGTCKLYFPLNRIFIVQYGVWYAGHTYKICNGVVYN